MSQAKTKSLDDVQDDFFAEVGHKPTTAKVLLAYCKQKGTGHKFSDVNKWWPNRPEPAAKSELKPTKAQDYKGI